MDPSTLSILTIATLLLANTRPMIRPSVCEDLAEKAPILEYQNNLLGNAIANKTTQLELCSFEKVSLNMLQINKSEGRVQKRSQRTQKGQKGITGYERGTEQTNFPTPRREFNFEPSARQV